MDIALLEPFVEETVKTFEVMLGVTPEERELQTKESTNGTHDVSAIIGVSGSGTGAVVLSFPKDAACKTVSKMIGEKLTDLDQSVTDGVGELVNIITGNAKRGLVKHGFNGLALSLPNVVVGKHRTVWRSKDMPCLMKRFFVSELGPFCLEVNVSRDR